MEIVKIILVADSVVKKNTIIVGQAVVRVLFYDAFGIYTESVNKR
jgi:hypothetical protein